MKIEDLPAAEFLADKTTRGAIYFTAVWSGVVKQLVQEVSE
jgi:hypothetical protein